MLDARRRFLASLVSIPGLPLRAAALPSFVAPAEFEWQEFIWLSWVERGNLGGGPFSDVALDVMRAVTPHVKVRLMFSAFDPGADSERSDEKRAIEAAARRLKRRLRREGIDLARVELFHHPQRYGAIQDPGPYFLRSADGRLALADYGFEHPNPRTEAMDREIAARLGLPTVGSALVSEGGARQVDGRGTLLLVEAVEKARNPHRSLEEIAREHLRVHGATQVVWLKQGPADEEWGRLADGRWGIGTGGHVDVFARFADPYTVLLAQVTDDERDSHPMLRETQARMEENFRILSAASTPDGRPFRILRLPVPDPETATVAWDSLSREERSWFEGAGPGQVMEFYLPAGYLNFIIANGVVVTGRFWRPGRPESQRRKDQLARQVLQRAFPGRQVLQIDVRPLLFDGAGLHCHSRNQPYAGRPRPWLARKPSLT